MMRVLIGCETSGIARRAFSALGHDVWSCDWWTSKDNQKRRQKPVPGDISEQAHKHAQIIRSGQKMIEAFEKFGDHPPAFLAR